MAQSPTSRAAAPAHGRRLRVSPLRLIWGTALTALVAVAVSAALFAVASAAGLVDERVVLPSPAGPGPLSLASVSAAAAIAIVAAAIVLLVLAAAARRPVRLFRILATVLAAVSLLAPATIAGVPVPMRLVLAGMHVMVWAVCVGLLPWLAIRRTAAAS